MTQIASYTGKRVLFAKQETVEIAPWSQESPGPGQVLVENVVSVVSAGTELSRLYNTHIAPQPFPRNTGYASVTRVVEVGKGVEGIEVGRLYLTQMGHISFGTVSPDSLVPLPDNVNPEHGVFAALGSISLRAIRQANVNIGDSVLVVGMGLIGQFALAFSKLSGCIPATGLDLSPRRRSIGQAMGCSYTLDPLAPDFEEQLSAVSADGQFRHVFDVTGTAQVFTSLPQRVANNGNLVILGGIHKTVDFDFYTHAQKRNLRILGAGSPDPVNWPYTESENRKAILALMSDGRLDVAPLLTHFVNVDEAPAIYKMLHDEKDVCMGAVFKWET